MHGLGVVAVKQLTRVENTQYSALLVRPKVPGDANNSIVVPIGAVRMARGATRSPLYWKALSS